MVRLTVYIEGGDTSSGNDETSIADNSIVFRESFSRLFSQQFSTKEFNLVIQPIGSVNETAKYLQKIAKQKIEGILLIDLDAPKNQKDEKLKSYSPLDTSIVFFMVQEMEAWILSQPEIIEKYGQEQDYTLKYQKTPIKDNPLLKNKHPEDIEKPSEKLNTILRQFFEVTRTRNGKSRTTGKRYEKMKDGPNLITLLSLVELKTTFDEVRSLVKYIDNRRQKDLDISE